MITRATDYAVRIILYLTKLKKGEIATKKELVEKCNVPSAFLSKIVQMLSKARIINITKGAYAGYMLTKQPENITLLEVIELIEGELFLNRCIKDKSVCEFSENCIIHNYWLSLTELLRGKLQEINFKELSEKDNCFIPDKFYNK